MKHVNIEVPLGGLDTFTDAKHVVPGKLDVAENVRFDGPPGFVKRFGYVQSPTDIIGGGNVSNGVRLASHRGEILLFTRNSLYAGSVAKAAWVNRSSQLGTTPHVSTEPKYYDQSFDIQSASVATNQGVTVVLWGESAATFSVAVYDSLGTLLAKEGTDFGANARVFALGNYIYIVSQDVTSLEWSRIDVTSSNFTFTTPAAFGTAIAIAVGVGTFDAVPLEGTTDSFLVAFRNTATGNVTVARFNTSNVQAWRTGLAEVADDCIGLQGTTAENVYVGWGNNANGVRYAVLNPATGAQVGANTTILAAASVGGDATRIGICRLNATNAMLVWGVEKQALGQPPSEYLPFTKYAVVSSSPATPGTIRNHYDCAPITRPWVNTIDSRVYLGSVFHEVDQGTGFVVDIGDSATPTASDPRWIATFARDQASAFATDAGLRESASLGLLSNVQLQHGTSAGKYVFGALLKQRLFQVKEFDGDDIRFQRGVGLVTLDFVALDRFDGCSWDRGYFVTGGVPSWYDGFQYAEHGFAWYPSVNRDSTAEATDDLADFLGGVLNPGGGAPSLFKAVNVYETIDANAMVQRSGVSRVMSHDAAAVANVFLRWFEKTGLLTNRTGANATAPQTYLYRTVENPTEDTFYRSQPYIGFPVTTNPTVTTNRDAGSATDGGDAIVAGREVVYTTGDILANDGTPPCKYCTVHGDRLWIAGLENPREIWFSQPFLKNEAPRFSRYLQLHVDADVTGIASMDDKLVVFTATRIYIVTGDGCPATGGADLGFEIRLVTSDAGCRDHRSIVSMPLGLMFWSYKGIYLLDRTLAVTYIGAPLHRTLTLQPTWLVVGAALNVDRNEVAFAINVGQEAGRLAVYNYVTQIWTVDVLPATPVSCAMILPEAIATFAFVNSSGVVYTESDAYTDPGTQFISSRIVTPWYKPSTILQGWGELGTILFLGNYYGRHIARVRVAFNYNEATWDETFTFSNAVLAALPVYQYEVKPARQQCESFRIEWTDLPDDTFGGDQSTKGGGLSSIVFRAGLVDQTAQLAAGARA